MRHNRSDPDREEIEVNPVVVSLAMPDDENEAYSDAVNTAPSGGVTIVTAGDVVLPPPPLY
jgi:hypothetical protein